ncbi:MAG TPA: aminoglycoside adenylyltransferase domain-containing protein [Devosiaceae bacterium]|nr:aminoglycoside adenylyltransferase domain-containing protein [Devosiaceae bacterium]
MADTSGTSNEVAFAAGELVRLLQRHVPGLVDSLYLVGSAADGDFRPGRSDLDFVAVLSRPASGSDLEALTIVHRLYASDLTFPALDGIWLTSDELTAGPDAAADGPTTQSGDFVEKGRGNRNPIAWLALRQQPLILLGKPPDRDALWYDPERVSSWTCGNVESYWTNWLQRASNSFSRPGLAMLGKSAPMWGVLGISRLHYTLATGGLASKAAAGEYALSAFDQRWQRIIREALRIRRGGGASIYRNPLARRRDALGFVAMVIADIRSRYCTSGLDL